jgi:hypothetical protein
MKNTEEITDISNKEISDHLKKLNIIQKKLTQLLNGLTHTEVTELLRRINRDIGNKSVYKPELPELPVIHGYLTL